jgi:hypothetical protein
VSIYNVAWTRVTTDAFGVFSNWNLHQGANNMIANNDTFLKISEGTMRYPMAKTVLATAAS